MKKRWGKADALSCRKDVATVARLRRTGREGEMGVS